MNQVILIGRTTKQPELKYIPSTGNAVTTFSLAVNRDFKDKDGNRQADFFNIVVFGKSAEYVANYLGKGKICAVRGRLQNESWEKNGEKKYATKIIADQVEILEWEKKEQGESTVSEIDGFRALEDESDVPF